MKKILTNILNGFSFGLGFMIIFILFFGIYAFVEPTESPISDYITDWNSPINKMHNETNVNVKNIQTTISNLNSKNIDWTNCEYKSFGPTTSSGSISCSTDYELVTWSGVLEGASDSTQTYIKPNGINSIMYAGNSASSNYYYVSGGIKCCKLQN